MQGTKLACIINVGTHYGVASEPKRIVVNMVEKPANNQNLTTRQARMGWAKDRGDFSEDTLFPSAQRGHEICKRIVKPEAGYLEKSEPFDLAKQY